MGSPKFHLAMGAYSMHWPERGQATISLGDWGEVLLLRDMISFRDPAASRHWGGVRCVDVPYARNSQTASTAVTYLQGNRLNKAALICWQDGAATERARQRARKPE
jgi:hypothetical protein